MPKTFRFVQDDVARGMRRTMALKHPARRMPVECLSCLGRGERPALPADGSHRSGKVLIARIAF